MVSIAFSFDQLRPPARDGSAMSRQACIVDAANSSWVVPNARAASKNFNGESRIFLQREFCKLLSLLLSRIEPVS